MALTAFVNGDYVASKEAMVSVFDHGFLYGDGCFEGIVVVDGRILHLDDHLRRLKRSAKYLRITFDYTLDELREILLSVASRSGMSGSGRGGYLRPVLTRGVGPVGVTRSADLTPTFVVLPQVGERTIAFDDEIESLTAMTSAYTSFPSTSVDPAVKANHYIPNVLAFLQARDAGVDVALLRSVDGYISEGFGMNVFAVASGVVITPPAGSILRGITRHYVLESVAALGLAVQERLLTSYDLINADEVFVTSSMNSVAAVVAVDGLPVADGNVGAEALRIRDRYLQDSLGSGTVVPG